MLAGLVSLEASLWLTHGHLLIVSSQSLPSVYVQAPLVSLCVSKFPLLIMIPVSLD